MLTLSFEVYIEIKAFTTTITTPTNVRIKLLLIITTKYTTSMIVLNNNGANTLTNVSAIEAFSD